MSFPPAEQPRKAGNPRRGFVATLGVLCALYGPFFPAGIGAQESGIDRSKPPQLGPPPALKLPPLVKRTLSNGLQVWLLETHEVPLVQVNLLVRAGSGDDPQGKFGVANLTAAMLDEGAGTRTALELADALEFLGASLNTSSSFDASAVRMNVPSARLAEALSIMADVALRPTFPAADFDLLRRERLTGLLQARDDPQQIVPIAFQRIVFGTHRYGTNAGGTEATLKAFTPSDLRAFHAAYYQPRNATLVVVGDITADKAVAQLEKPFGQWKMTAPATRTAVPAAPQLTRGQIYIVDKPGAAQSQIRIGWVGVARDTPDYFTLQVLNTILGGSFSSRLNQNLREEHQYTYGATSRFEMRLAPGPFTAGAAVQTDKTAEAVREFFNELNAIQKPVPADELNRAKNYLSLGFPADFETTSALSQKLEEMIAYRLPDGYFARYIERIQAVDAAAVQKAAATYIQPSRLAVVVVGDRAAIEPGLRALNLGPVQVMTVEEAMGP